MTSGRLGNEATFLYQWFAREFGTNNLPDCSNMCREASGRALTASIGTGKGTVDLVDWQKADAIFVMGVNAASNAPRMLTALADGVKERRSEDRACEPVDRSRGHPRDHASRDSRHGPVSGHTHQLLESPTAHRRRHGPCCVGSRSVCSEVNTEPQSGSTRLFIDRFTSGLEGVSALLPGHPPGTIWCTSRA